jgi:aspartyl/glutamyl-tRNA(Asn/Gln) amidotransferase C subunit
MTEPISPKHPKVDEKVVLHVAKLARLKVPKEALLETINEMESFLHFVQQLPSQGQDQEPSDAGKSLSRRPDLPRADAQRELISLSAGHQDDFVIVPAVLKS